MKQNNVRKLEDLNVIDNFLFQELLSQEGDGEEFARILLKTILNRPIRNVKIIPQKNVPGIDVDKHGIRLDAYIEEVVDELNGEMADAEIIPNIYDIEPNNTYERKTLPKRMRYYHGLIDTKLLSAGAGYDTSFPMYLLFLFCRMIPLIKIEWSILLGIVVLRMPPSPMMTEQGKSFFIPKGRKETLVKSLEIC